MGLLLSQQELQNFDSKNVNTLTPLQKKQYFAFMFGDKFMHSKNKGELVEYNA